MTPITTDMSLEEIADRTARLQAINTMRRQEYDADFIKSQADALKAEKEAAFYPMVTVLSGVLGSAVIASLLTYILTHH